ncbi:MULTISPECIES: restriction endonuclease [unclassified Bifidobacterium]|uniref:restriction endonuclease n=1 Tax=unclassified Bifidobacterium TaxID=2608897 RepID=UPI0023F85C45|nr:MULTISPECIES: restriction endonuclease [unclassified Bifidobacterium]WEV65357.1 restriction endonuclease [Bifidobacterium sp. ESL0764]WEV75840.1 restriction endonuclease [Bifidobacterium sp. ESL0800]
MTDSDVSDKLIKLIPVLKAHAIPLAIAVAGIILVVLLLREFWQLWLRGRVRKICNVEVPKGVRISHSRDANEIGSFVLNYPFWRFAKKNGTADRRHSNNKICKPKSTLEVAGFSFKSKNPLTLYGLVLDMRRNGNSIGYSRSESFKRQRAVQRVKVRQRATSVQAIVDSFSSQPTDFELFCADLYRHYGYQVAVTQSNNDGGFDLKMTKDGHSYIAECKCFEPYRHVGLPLLRKLAGANEIQHAQGLIFITTSTYTAQAVKYANEAGIQLVDGSTLVQMCQQAWGNALPQQAIDPRSFELTEGDLLANIPADMQYKFA